MTSGSGEDGKKYAWQSWPSDSLEGMPPTRRRLVVWGLLWLMFLNFVLRSALDAAGIPEPWLSVAFAAVVAAVFVPLIRGVVSETRALRAEGVHVPTDIITRKSLIVASVINGALWIVVAIFAFLGEFVFPLVPIACTVWLAFHVRHWRSVPR